MTSEVLFSETEMVSVGALKPYDKNPRKGDVRAIAESLTTNKQYRPIVVQKKTRKILAGNHTWQAAKMLKWDKIAVVYVDVDDEQAARIVLADNRTNDLAAYDNKVLAELLADLGDSVGTGYSEDDMQAILSAAQVSMKDIPDPSDDSTLEDIFSASDAASEGRIPRPFGGDLAEDEFGDADLNDEEAEEDEFVSAQAQLQGILQLADDVYFEMGKNKYDIPPYRKDNLVTELPEPLQTWGGKDATPDDGVTTWIWNYGLASPTGMPYDRSILCFYTYDYKFETWWDKPSYYTAKVMNLGVKTAIAPDFSVWYDDPKVFQLYSIYRAQWFGRYFQEAGMKVIPRVIMSNSQEVLDISFMGIPRKAPVISMSMQTFDEKVPEELKAAKDSLEYICATLQPETLLVYGGNPAKRLCESSSVGSTNVVHVINYAGVRRGTVFDNPDGIEGEKRKKGRPGGLA
jgi:hypothetical protein